MPRGAAADDREALRQDHLIVGGGSGHARTNFGAYAASKAAVARFAECLAEEVRDHNVQVNSISPGGAYTHNDR